MGAPNKGMSWTPTGSNQSCVSSQKLRLHLRKDLHFLHAYCRSNLVTLHDKVSPLTATETNINTERSGTWQAGLQTSLVCQS